MPEENANASRVSPEDVPPRIDTHAHVFTRSMPFLPDAWTRLDYDFTFDEYVATLDAHGIAHGVISGLSIAGTYNDYSLEAVRRHKRLRATAIVAPDIERSALDVLDRAGFVGIRLQLARMVQLPDFAGAQYRNLFRHLRDLDWHVHLAIEGPRLPDVLGQLERSGVRIVLDHFGHPDPQQGTACPGYQAMLRATDRGRTWVKLSAGFRLLGTDAWRTNPDGDAGAFALEMARHLVASVSPDRLFWGSDAPFVGYEGRLRFADVLGSFRQWVPDPAVRARISQTGMAFYFRDGSP